MIKKYYGLWKLKLCDEPLHLRSILSKLQSAYKDIKMLPLKSGTYVYCSQVDFSNSILKIS
jgi:hypothetical protein